MAAGNNIIAFGGGEVSMTVPALKTEYSGAVGRCRDSLMSGLAKRLDALFEQLDDSFYELADKAGTNVQQELYFDAMREVRKQREITEKNITQQIKLGFDRFWHNGSNAGSGGGLVADSLDGDLELLENVDLEEDLAVSTMVSKGNNNFYRDLYALDQRFSVMLGGCKVETGVNPVSPAVFGEAIKSAVSDLEMDITIKLVIYKQYERQVIDHLGEIYDPLNELLAKADILPTLKRTVRRHQSRGGARRVDGDTSNVESHDLDQYAVDASAVDSEVFATLQSLLVQRRGDSAVPSGQERLQLLPAPELIAMLSGLQNAAGGAWLSTPQNEGSETQSIKSVLALDGAKAERRINQADEDVIDVISMLFEFILEDPSLPDAMRAMLARLQIPMLKVAILDKTFFSRTEHPARRLLNSLAQAAVGWSENLGRGAASLYGQIESIVERIMREFDDDVELFDDLYRQFADYQEREQKGAGIAENRATQVTQGKERLVGAKAEVDQAISAAIAKYVDEVPVVVKNLLNDGWKGVLLTILLREGSESQDWVDALDTMDRLIWSIQPKPDVKERQALLKAIPQLLKRLRAGLGDISYDQHKMASMFKTLQACHVKCLRNTSVKQRAMEVARVKRAPIANQTPQQPIKKGFALDEEAKSSAENISEEIVLESPSSAQKIAHESAETDQFTTMAASLTRGAWIERTDEQGEVTRAKLSWRSGISGVCLFVNRKGIKVAEVTPQALAAWFRGGTAVILEGAGVPLMDRALSAMVDVLNKDGPKKG
jgi:hypothetical protein